MDLEFIRELVDPAEARIVLLVMDGLGGLPLEPGGPTALEAGRTPNLDDLAVRSICGLHQPVAPGITPGSGPSHLALFGYDPMCGFSSRPAWPPVGQVYGLRAAAIATYPMYRGVAQLVGMVVLDTGTTVEEELDTLEEHWDDFDFFFVHVKPIDSAGEDGDFDRKVALIEAVDALVPRILDLGPDVMIVTGDHSTPSALKYHSWHPVPVLMWSKYCRPDGVKAFGERACMAGGLGPRIPATDLMPLALANAGWLQKFGA